MRARRLGQWLLAILLLAPVASQAWWNSDWPYRIRVDYPGSIAAAQVIPVRLHVGNFSFQDARPDGSDIRFVSGDDKTPLNFHFEGYDSAEQLATAWVQLPPGGESLPVIWVYYGNQKAPAVGSSRATYDTGYQAVFHFAEKSGVPRDSTGVGVIPSQFGGHLGTDGVVDTGAHFARTENLVLAGSLPVAGSDDSHGFTLSTWFKLTDVTTSSLLVSRAADAKSSFAVGVANGKLFVDYRDGNLHKTIEGTEKLSKGRWCFLTLTWSDKVQVYLDGKVELSLPSPAGALGNDLVFGTNPLIAGGFDGSLDELQVQKGVRQAAWVAASFTAQDPVVEAASVGGAEEGGGSDYFSVLKTLARSVSTDGWIIVGVIALLGLISVEVMMTKLLLLRRIASANSRFLARYRQLGGDPTSMLVKGQASELEDSRQAMGLIALYRQGVEEFRRQQEAVAAAGEKRLEPAHFEVIKASIESSLVSESHRMNSSLVLLTLAVSAAPFLGLLGTVVGIMITFASIAASGDVNVNTIAPGVAAALICTVAGLIVAIPALFGYNFLATRVRELTQAMEVFANELVGRLATVRLSA